MACGRCHAGAGSFSVSASHCLITAMSSSSSGFPRVRVRDPLVFPLDYGFSPQGTVAGLLCGVNSVANEEPAWARDAGAAGFCVEQAVLRLGGRS